MNRCAPLLTFAIVMALVGCSSVPKPLAESIPGSYAMVAGGFNESLAIELKKDFTYSMDHELIGCTDLSVTQNREEGVWKFVDGLVSLEPKSRTKDFPDAQVFAPASFRRLMPKDEGRDFYLVNPDFPKHCILKKKKTANQSVQTTAMASPASAMRVAPLSDF